MRFQLPTFCICVFAASAVAIAEPFSPEQIAFFEQKVRPILHNQCVECHGEKKQESDLRLDSRAALLAGGAYGESLVNAKQPGEGLLIKAVRRQGDLKMPPEKELSAEEIAVLEQWVAMNVPWPEEGPPAAPVTMEERTEQHRQTHWAYQPIGNPQRPAVAAAAWPQGEIDYFILARLEEAGLKPSPDADRRTLIRRLTFDLWGLPPTPQEVEQFVNDDRPQAHSELVDRLLASPRYGQRWARHWLDIARYADTRGYAFTRDRNYAYAYTYRDYVIEAFNRDLPYDRFLLEQLAADQLNLSENDPALAALGFLTVGRKFNNIHDDLDDQIDVVARGLLGLTIACARCHDHKYDAIPTDDYYSLKGIFASSHQPDDLPLIGQPPDTPEYRKFQEDLANKRQALDDFNAQKHRDLLDTSRSRVADYLVRVISNKPERLLEKLPFLSLNREDLKPKLVQRWRQHLQQAKPDDALWGLWHELRGLEDDAFPAQASPLLEKWLALPPGTEPGQMLPQLQNALREKRPENRIDLAVLYGNVLSAAYNEWKGASPEAREAFSADKKRLLHELLQPGGPTDIPANDLASYFTREENNRLTELKKAIDTHESSSPHAAPRAMVLRDNNPHDEHILIRGNPGRRGELVPRRFPVILSGEDRLHYQQGSGRLQLARAIVDSSNPLTARVMANRVWMHHFGEPLVETPSDFGVRSDPPSHPQLLDYLASRFKQGWSLKQLHREILLSRAYRQQSRDREECRKVDPENRLLWRMNRQRLEFEPLRDSLLYVAGNLIESHGGKSVDIFKAPFSNRRSVYAYIDRQDLPNLLRAFDFASPDQSSARRPETMVPQQVLFLLNSPFVVEQAKSLARRAEAAGDNPQARVSAVYGLVLQRAPTEAEFAVSLEIVNQPAVENSASNWVQLAQLLLLTNEFSFVD